MARPWGAKEATQEGGRAVGGCSAADRWLGWYDDGDTKLDLETGSALRTRLQALARPWGAKEAAQGGGRAVGGCSAADRWLGWYDDGDTKLDLETGAVLRSRLQAVARSWGAKEATQGGGWAVEECSAAGR